MQADTPTLLIEINDENFIFAACEYENSENLKIVEKITTPCKGIDKKKFVNIEEVEVTIKENVKLVENKLNCIFKEVILIIDSFDYLCINISGFKKLNGSQVLKENISYILNLLKLTVSEKEQSKTILHIFNSKSILDGTYVKNLPIGLFGDFYSHELTFFLIGNNDHKNINQVFKKNNLKIQKILIKNFIEGVQLINQNNIQSFFKIKIKKDQSNLTFFDDSSFRYREHFKFGSSVIIQDIAKVCSLEYEFIEKILLDKLLIGNNFKDDELIEEKYFTKESYRKIRKKLIKDIARTRIEEIVNIIINKNINLGLFKKDRGKIYVTIEDKLILDNFQDEFNSCFLQNTNFITNFIEDFGQDSSMKSAANLLINGWKKEAVPIAQTKNSLISRIFKSLFE